MRLFAFLVAALPSVTLAEGIVATPHARAAQSLTSVADFETPELKTKRRNEPDVIEQACASFGSAFSGHQVEVRRLGKALFDGLTGQPTAPLTLANPSSAWHLMREQLSNGLSTALMGIGPRGYGKSGGGEGSIAILFHVPQSQVALTYDAERPGNKPVSRGNMTLKFYDSEGVLLATRVEKLRHRGYRAYRTVSGRDVIKGISITNTDPGGIAIDDVRMRCDTLPMS